MERQGRRAGVCLELESIRLHEGVYQVRYNKKLREPTQGSQPSISTRARTSRPSRDMGYAVKLDIGCLVVGSADRVHSERGAPSAPSRLAGWRCATVRPHTPARGAGRRSLPNRAAPHATQIPTISARADGAPARTRSACSARRRPARGAAPARQDGRRSGGGVWRGAHPSKAGGELGPADKVIVLADLLKARRTARRMAMILESVAHGDLPCSDVDEEGAGPRRWS